MSDSDMSSQGGAEYKTFRQITRDRLLYEMVRSVKSKDTKATWKVLIMDKLTVKIMSNSCKMADITDEGVSLVEDLYKRRQPMPAMDAIYFMQPLEDNIMTFLSDMTGKKPLYKKAYVFFSSPVSKELLSHIKNDHIVSARIGALSEMNLEYLAIDSQGFITDNEKALEELFAEGAQHSHTYNSCINTMAIRIATVFASLREFPYVRYRAAKSSFDASIPTTHRDLVPTKLAAEIWNCLARYKTTIPNFPQRETCELLIVDRSVDQIAPIIHEWTYDAMCHDLLGLEGNKYVQEVHSKSGSVEKKEVLLEEHDPIWLELRHAHIADASERLHDKMTNFISQTHPIRRDGGELSTRDLQKIVQGLPNYNEQIDKISLHVEIAGKINKMIRELGLKDIGQLEQDLVFGYAGTKALIEFLRKNQDASHEIKLRLLMIYAAINPENFESDKGAKLLQLAKLSEDDAIAVNNMKWLGHTVSKKSSGVFSLKFDIPKKKHGVRKERNGEDEQWALSKFYPMIEELIDKLSKGGLPKDEYQCMNGPSPAIHETTQSASITSSPIHTAHSMRSRRTPTWARPRASDDGCSSDSVLKYASNNFKKTGQRIFLFIVGGATRSEIRAVHKLTSKLKREIILGSTSLDDPAHFIKKTKLLSAKELSLDNLEI